MPSDASFEDGAERPVHLVAVDEDDLAVISALVQDAVFPITEMRWDRRRRRFGLLLNRFRWEDREKAEARGRPYERVQSLLVIDDVSKVQSQGIDRGNRDLVLSVLSLAWEAEGAPQTSAPGDETADDGVENTPSQGPGRLILTLAGDGAVALDAECLDVTLKDVTRPYAAPSGRAPSHE